MQELFDLFGESLHPYAQLGMDRDVSPMDCENHSSISNTATSAPSNMLNTSPISEETKLYTHKSAQKNAKFLKRIAALQKKNKIGSVPVMGQSQNTSQSRNNGTSENISYYDLPYVCL